MPGRQVAVTGFSIVRRSRDLDRMTQDTFDLVVVGGGITGAGIALDASTRGLSVALVEKGDFASGTSSRSSRLIHGGLRYLRQREFGLVREALRERQHLSEMAPHLVKPLPFLLPILEGSPFDDMKTALRAGLWLYDLAGGARGGRFHERVSRDESLELSPALRSTSVLDGFIYWDAVNDDARTTLAVIRTAAMRYDAAVANYCEALAIECSVAPGRRDGGHAAEVAVRDIPTGEVIAVRARAVLVASGVWSDLLPVSGGHPIRERRIRPAKGIHIVVPRHCIPGDAAVLLPVPGDDRFIFTIPWGGYTLVGTTDTDYKGPLDDPAANEDEIRYLLDTVNTWISQPIDRSSVTGAYAGLRPLAAADDDEKTADMSRKHVVETIGPCVGAIYGGKFTTWRSMAVEAVDFAGERLGLGDLPKSVTASQSIDGALGEDSDGELATSGIEELAPGAAERIESRYGSHARAIGALCEDPALRQSFSPSLDYLMAEATYAARHEMVVNLDDILSRRTRSSTDNWAAARECAPAVAAVVAADLQWNAETQSRQVQDFLGTAQQYDPTPSASTATTQD